MDKFLDSMLGDRGCAADGSTTNNPVAQMVDRVFDSHLGFLGTSNGQDSTGLMDRTAFYDSSTQEQLVKAYLTSHIKLLLSGVNRQISKSKYFTPRL